ncbi:unnamed protein product [Lota lota]
MASRCGEQSTGLKTTKNRRDASEPTEDGDDAAKYVAATTTALPRWMRLYFYGMHGVTLDILLSSLQGLFYDRDPKLVGYSSPYLCLMHSLTHLVLEQIYARKKCFRGRPVVFSLVYYPSVYIGLQVLIGNMNARTEQALAFSASQLAAQYVVALYFSQVFHRGLSRLQYHHPGFTDHKNGVRVERPEVAACRSPGETELPLGLKGLPDLAHFVFYGMHGFLDEVVFTSVFNLMEKSDRSFSGHTSLWSFLMYGSCSFVVEKLYMRLRYAWGWGTWRRLPVYVCFIYAWEFSWGLALRQFDACSWDYSHYPHNFMGLVTLVYMPGWVCLSLYQDVLSNVLFRVQCVGVKDEGGLAGRKEEEGANGNMDQSKKVL